MQALSKKVFMAFFVFIFTSNTALVHGTSAETMCKLDEIIMNLEPEEQQHFLHVVNELEKLAREEKEKNGSDINRSITKLIDSIPFKKLTALSLRIALAVICWEYIQPNLKRQFPNHETAVELPKVLAGALIIDSIKEFFKKEVKDRIEDRFEIIYDVLTA